MRLPQHSHHRIFAYGPATAVIACIALLALVVACGGDQPAGSGHGDGFALYPKLPHVTGHIDRVDARTDSPRYFSALLITDADGMRWEFRAEGWVGVSVGHLKDHQIQGTPVTVWYEPQGISPYLARFVGD